MNVVLSIFVSNRCFGVLDMSVFAFLGLLSAVLCVTCLLSPKEHRSHPIFVPERVAFLSHAIGIFRHGALYYQSIRDRTKLANFGLRVFRQKFYVITDLRLISILQRHRNISFDPFVLLAAQRLSGASKAMLDTMHGETMQGKNMPSSLMSESHALLQSTFGSRAHLKIMVDSVLKVAEGKLRRAEREDLFGFIRHIVCIANTDMIYGPKNPFKVNVKLEEAFWDYDSDLSMLLLNFLPKITARKGYRARHVLRKAFTDYFLADGADEASEFIQASNAANISRSVAVEDRAGFQVVYCIGLLVNTPPTLFWMLYHVYSNPELLQGLRAELCAASVGQIDSKYKPGSPDLHTLMASCPLLYATLWEVLRMHASSLSTRIVLEDTCIGDSYLLEKGGIVHMPSNCLHYSEEHFNSHVDVFNPTRFLGAERSKLQTAFRPFGGGSTLCPGRHFATMQILGITAHILQSYDLTPEDGKWIVPRSLQNTMTTTVLPPLDTVRVRFRRRSDDPAWRQIS